MAKYFLKFRRRGEISPNLVTCSYYELYHRSCAYYGTPLRSLVCTKTSDKYSLSYSLSLSLSLCESTTSIFRLQWMLWKRRRKRLSRVTTSVFVQRPSCYYRLWEMQHRRNRGICLL